MPDFPRLRDWAVRFPRQPVNSTFDGYSYEYVKLYAAQCDTCGAYKAAPTKREMHQIMMLHRDHAHGRPVIASSFPPQIPPQNVPDEPPF